MAAHRDLFDRPRLISSFVWVSVEHDKIKLQGNPSMHSRPLGLALLLSVLLALTFAQTTWAQRARMSYAGTAGFNMPFIVAYEAGLYRKYGLRP